MQSRAVFVVASALMMFLGAVLKAADGGTQSPSTRPAIHVAHAGLVKLTWQLAVPTGTFTDRSVFDAIDLLHGLDIHHLELTPGQALQSGMPGVQVAHTMSAEAVTALMAKLKAVHMDVVSYGPVDLGPDDASARLVFAFAKRIKAKDIIAAPPADSLERLDKLATEYGVNLAIRNAAEDPSYRLPSDLLTAVASRSLRIGSDDDLVQWQSAGADPLEATRSLHGHIVQIRVGNADAGSVEPVLAELKSQKFKGVVTMVCTPGGGDDEVGKFVTAVNALSDAVTTVAAEK